MPKPNSVSDGRLPPPILAATGVIAQQMQKGNAEAALLLDEINQQGEGILILRRVIQ